RPPGRTGSSGSSSHLASSCPGRWVLCSTPLAANLRSVRRGRADLGAGPLFSNHQPPGLVTSLRDGSAQHNPPFRKPLRWRVPIHSGTSSAIATPPTPTLPHKGGGSQKSPPPLWGRVGWGAGRSHGEPAARIDCHTPC